MIDSFFNAFAAAENDMLGSETAKLVKVLRLARPNGHLATDLDIALPAMAGDTVVVLSSPDGKIEGYVGQDLTVTIGGHGYVVAKDCPRAQDGTVAVTLKTGLLAGAGSGDPVILSASLEFDLPHSMTYMPRLGFIPGELTASMSTAISVPKLTAGAEPKLDDILTCSLGSGAVLGFLPPDGGSWEVLVGRAIAVRRHPAPAGADPDVLLMPNNFEAVGAAMQDWTLRVLPRIGVALQVEAAAFLAARNAELSPVGDAPRDSHPGKLAASWRASAGDPDFASLADAPSYPSPSGNRMEFIPPMRGLHPGGIAHVTNDAKSDAETDGYAYLMAVLGESPKAPLGTVRPSFFDLGDAWQEVARVAILRVLAEEGAVASTTRRRTIRLSAISSTLSSLSGCRRRPSLRTARWARATEGSSPRRSSSNRSRSRPGSRPRRRSSPATASTTRRCRRPAWSHSRGPSVTA